MLSKQIWQGHECPGGGPRILIIDDDVNSVFPLVTLISHLGCQVKYAYDPLSAVACIDSSSKVDLLIVDWMMPGLSGFETLAQIHSNIGNRSRRVPYIVYSSMPIEQLSFPETERIYCYDHWEKPLFPLEIVKSVNRFLCDQK